MLTDDDVLERLILAELQQLRAEAKAYADIETARWVEAKGIWESTVKPVFTFIGKYLTLPTLSAALSWYLTKRATRTEAAPTPQP